MNKRVIIIYEHKLRELESSIMLQIYLNKIGLKCEILHLSNRPRFKDLFFKPRVVLLPSFYSEGHVKFLKNKFFRNCIILNLRYEQLYSSWIDESNFQFNYSFLNNIYNIAWGDYTQQRLIKAGLSNEFILKFGHINLDLCKQPFLDNYFYDKKFLATKYDLNIKKKWILFVSSFGIEENSDKAYKNYLANLKLQNIDDLSIISSSSKKSILVWLLRILNDNNHQIIYRPHPSEMSDKNLLEISQKNHNFKIVEELNIKQWFKECDYVFSWMSTSSLEAQLINKDVYILRPEYIPEKYENIMYYNSESITRYDEIQSVISAGGCSKKFHFNYSLFYDFNNNYTFLSIGNLVKNMIVKPGNYKFYKLRYSLIDLKHLLNIFISQIINYIFIYYRFRLSWIIPIKKNQIMNIENFKKNTRDIISVSEYRTVKGRLENIINKILEDDYTKFT